LLVAADLNEATLLIDPTRVVVGEIHRTPTETRRPAATNLSGFTVQALRAYLNRLDGEKAAWGTGYDPVRRSAIRMSPATVMGLV
jgi:hypothetical protein